MTLLSVDRTLEVLDVLVDRGSVGVSELATKLCVAASTAHRMLDTLLVRQYVVKDEDTKRYYPGPRMRGLSHEIDLIAGSRAGYAATDVPALIARLEMGLPADATIFGANRLGNVVNFAVPGVNNATAMMGLDLLGLSVSSGSACSSGKVGPSHVLAAMGVAPELADCALRVSLGWNSTGDDVDAFVAGYRSILERQRARQGQAA